MARREFCQGCGDRRNLTTACICGREWCARTMCEVWAAQHIDTSLPYYDDCALAQAKYPAVHAALVQARVGLALEALPRG